MRAISGEPAKCAAGVRVEISLALCFLALQVLGFGFGTVLLASTLSAQDTGRTVRHHRVAEEDPSFPPSSARPKMTLRRKTLRLRNRC